MIIFINNIEVYILKEEDFQLFSFVKKFNEISENQSALSDQTLYIDAEYSKILNTIKKLQSEKSKIKRIGFQINEIEEFEDYLKGNTIFIEAAGGVVKNNNQEVLMIKRLGKWDLPKGKVETGEALIETAEREVNEECGVEVKATEKITVTWHTYMLGGSLALKRTHWYFMGLVSDQNMKPQVEEDIEQLKWMTHESAYKKALKSYKSIQYVLEKWKLIETDF